MKTPLLSFIFLFSFSLSAFAQITTASTIAYFGVDADLKARYVNGSLSASDDWYVAPGTIGTSSNGTHVIDTTGAAAILAGYATDISPYPKRMASFFRGMSKPAFTVVNNRIWLDALFVRDFHGNDRTVFTSGADKNGQSPQFWSGGIQGIPDKNDILDMYLHVRREGPTSTYPLWFFGGLSLDNVTGNRYFDFELYQTDIYYDLTSQKWYGYRPDAGHTKWQFDAAGNIIKSGDIIFTAEYQSSSLTNIEARIWVDKANLALTPSAFNWSGQFDGASSGAQYGYASILPKTVGDFYIGLQCGNGEWAGAFSLVLQDNSLSTTYAGKQFMEFGVNLTKLGLDPVTTFGGDVCGTPFNRIVVKTRASASFTAELKDFVAPIDLFLAPRADASANVPVFCGTLNSASDLQVVNPSANSVYTWTTIDGHIVGNPVSDTVTADAPGTYVVTQQLMAGCSVYATDTVVVLYDEDCTTLEGEKVDFKVNLKNLQPLLNWTSFINNKINYYEIQRSTDGKNFYTIERLENGNSELAIKTYSFTDVNAGSNTNYYYRLKLVSNNEYTYSRIGSVSIKDQKAFSLLPNPAFSYTKVSLFSYNNDQVKLVVYNMAGELLYSRNYNLTSGYNTISLENINRWKTGMYMVNIRSASINQWEKLVIGR
jgi:hypothetical protein